MSNVFDHLHIKQHTVGSSNELSFDVLDAARTGLDDKPHKRKRESSLHTASQARSGSLGSYHGTTGTSSLSRQAEVTRRKQARKVRSLRLTAVAIVVVLAIMGTATYVAYGQYQRMQEFQVKFDGVVQRFIAADQNLPAMDEFMSKPNQWSHDERLELQQDMQHATIVLDNILDDQGRVRSFAVTSRDEAALEQVVIAADARLQMIESANQTVAVAENSAYAANEVNSIWNNVIDADQKARDASLEANSASSDADVKTARKTTQEAHDSMKESLARLEEIRSTAGDLDLNVHISYLSKRIEALEHALATSDALLEGDRDKAYYENDLYNAGDRESVELAQLIPKDVDETVNESFEKNVQPHKDDYEKARERAIEADSYIRQYLGT